MNYGGVIHRNELAVWERLDSSPRSPLSDSVSSSPGTLDAQSASSVKVCPTRPDPGTGIMGLYLFVLFY